MEYIASPLNDMQYLMHHVFSLSSRLTRISSFSYINQNSINSFIQSAKKVSEDDDAAAWLSLFTTDDYEVFEDQNTLIYSQALSGLMIEIMAYDDFHSSLNPAIILNVIKLIKSYGNQALIDTYYGVLLGRECSVTLSVQDPVGRLDSTNIRVSAEANRDHTYCIHGQKVCLRVNGETSIKHNIHLVLADLNNDECEVKAQSLFLVTEEGQEAKNAINYRINRHISGTSVNTALVTYNDAKGYLIGDKHQGMEVLSEMITHQYFFSAALSTGLAQNAYHLVREYTKNYQTCSDDKEPKNPQPLIMRPEIRRILMSQRATIEGARALTLYTGLLLDQANGLKSSSPELALQKYKLSQLLTPVLKVFISDMAFDVVVTAQQIVGTEDFLIDSKLSHLAHYVRLVNGYESANQCVSLNIMTHALLENRGAFLSVYLQDINAYIIEITANAALMPFTESLKAAVNTLEQVTRLIFMQAGDKPDLQGVVAKDYVHLIGHVSFAYMWTKMAEVSLKSSDNGFHDAKVKTGLFYIQHLLVKISVHAAAISAGADTTMSLSPEQF